MRFRQMTGGAGIFLFLFVLFTPAALSENGEQYEFFLQQQDGFYANTVNYLRAEQQYIPPLNLTVPDYWTVTFIDAFLFAFCLWWALVLLGRGSIIGRQYLYLMLSFNFFWLVCLIMFQFIWGVASYLLLHLQPNYTSMVVDILTLSTIISGIMVYVWLLARIFKLSFYGAVGTCVLAHLIYMFMVIWLLTVVPAHSEWESLAQFNLGARPILHNYLRDVNTITAGESIFYPLRIRAMHL